jgi:hypothetical protein
VSPKFNKHPKYEKIIKIEVCHIKISQIVRFSITFFSIIGNLSMHRGAHIGFATFH